MTQSRPPEYFEKLYEANPDPWDFQGSSYEKRKYQATLAMLEGRRFEAGFEIGCSIGVLTRMLAVQCDALLAVDLVDRPLAAAAARCRDLGHVRFEKRRIPRDWPEGQKFDLILLSEVLYFLTQDDIFELARRVDETLLPGGTVLLVNFTEQIDEPCNGDDAAASFIGAVDGRLAVRRQMRAETYRIDLLGG